MKNTGEEPKSIWKKSWGMPGSFLGWLVLIPSIAFFVSLLGALIVDGVWMKKDWGIVAVVTTVGVAGAWLFLFIRWLCCWRNLCRFLLGLAGLAVLIALFYAEEDWRGWHAWQKFKHEWEAKGERFDFASFIPPAVPDDQNFAMTPIVASSWEAMVDKNGHQIQPPNTNVVDRLQMFTIDYIYNNYPTNGTGNWQKSTASNLKVWQEYYRTLAKTTNVFPVAQQPQTTAAAVLFALSKYDSAIEELRRASQLPYSRFPNNYDAGNPFTTSLPQLAALKRCSQVLQLRAVTELQNGQSKKALEDVKLSLRLADSIRTEPFLISGLVRMAIVQITLQPVWEGLAEHKWSDAQLAELERELEKLDFLADFEFSMRGERAASIKIIDYWHHLRNYSEINSELGIPEKNKMQKLFAKVISCMTPSSFFYQNELTIAKMHQQWILPLIDVEHRVVPPKMVYQKENAATNKLNHFSPYNIFARLLLPSMSPAVKKFAYEQESVDLTGVACSLERYRLAHGKYPESLNALTPQFIAKLPHDIINGQPLNYRRTADGQFVLYSVGWNEKDDGGVVGLREGGSVDITKGDWVWRYPSK